MDSTGYTKSIGTNTGTNKNAMNARGFRSNREKKQYDKLKELEKQQQALERLQSNEFQNILKRYYSNRPTMLERPDFNTMSKPELLDYFYNDRTWRTNNTMSLTRDVYDLQTGSDQDLQDWAIINQTFVDLPNWYDDPNRSFVEWAKDFAPAMVADPINIIGFGVGGQAVKQTVAQVAKAGMKEVGKNELKKQAIKKGMWLGAKREAKVAGATMVGFDALMQSNEMTAGLTDEFNFKRTMLAGGVGALTGGVMGAGFGAWGTKSKIGNYYKDLDGELVDVKAFGTKINGVAATKKSKGFHTDEKGNIIESNGGELGVGARVIADDRGNVGTVMSMSEGKIKVQFVSEDGAKATKTFKEDNLTVIQGVDADPTILPPELAGAKPTYNYGDRSIELEFENDIAKALYIVGGKGESASHKAYMAFLEKAGVKDIAKKAQAVRDEIKAQAKGGSDVAQVKAKTPKPKKKPIVKPDETEVIKKKADDVDKQVKTYLDSITRKIFKNKKRIKSDTAPKTFERLLRKIVKGELNSTIRLSKRNMEDVLKKIEEAANTRFKSSTRKEILADLKLLAETGTEGGERWTVGRMFEVNVLESLEAKLKIHEKASTPVEKNQADKMLEESLDEAISVMEAVDKIATNMSDNLASGNIVVGGTEATFLRRKYIATEIKNVVKNIKRMPKGEEKSLLLKNIARNMKNENRMNKIIRKANMNTKEGRVRFGEWLNEYTTANLLFDATTHMVNLLSGAIRYQWSIAQALTRGAIMSRANKKQGLQQMAMAADLFTGQFRFFNIAFKKAQMSWKANRAIGDSIEHRVDGRQQRSMEIFSEQLKQENSISARMLGKAMSPFSKLIYHSLKGLQAGDTFMKQAFNRAARVANVNQRLRTQYPELWNGRKIFKNKVSAVKEDQTVKHLDELIRFEQAKTKPNVKRIEKYQKKIKALQEQIKIKDKDEFSRTWKELFNQYEDEFGNFTSTKMMSETTLETFDDLSKHILNDPLFIARENTFTNSLRSDIVPDAVDPLMNNNDGFSGWLLRKTNQLPIFKVLFGLHFIKTPAQLQRFAWQNTPFLNKLHFQFKAMADSPDPITRAHARTITATGTALYGMGATMAMLGKNHGGKHPDPEKKYSLEFIDENGEPYYVQYKRLWPLSIPLQVTADISDMMKEMPDIWGDPMHQQANDKFGAMAMHMGASTMAMFSNIMSANLMTSDMFDTINMLFDGAAGYSDQATETKVSLLKKDLVRKSTKLIPAVTAWRWSNRELAEADKEARSMSDIIAQSTPIELAKLLDIDLYHLQPKRDPAGNKQPKVQGMSIFGVTNWDNPLKVSSNWWKDILETQDGKDRLASVDIGYTKPLSTVTEQGYKIADMNNLYVTGYKHPVTKQMVKGDGTQTFYDLMLQLKSEMRLGGKTLNERLREMYDNPSSQFRLNVISTHQMQGKNLDGDYTREIIRAYEQAAKEWLIFHTYNGEEVGNKPIIVQKMESTMSLVMMVTREYKEATQRDIKRLNALTNGKKTY